MKLDISQVSNNDIATVDLYLNTRSDALPYHHVQWLRAIHQAYGYSYVYWVARRGDEIVGVLPICEFVSITGRRKHCSLPFCDVGGAVANDEDIKNELVNHAIGYLETKNCDLLEVRTRLNPIGPVESLSGKKVCMLLKLPPDADTLKREFKSKLRSQINKAEKNGLRFESSSDAKGVLEFFDVFSRNMLNLGSPVHSSKWFLSLQSEYRENMLIGKVFLDRKIVGVGVILFSGENVCIPWASTLHQYNRLAPNMWLYWNLLKIACERGCENFDFGRSTYQEGTFKFKEQWGAKPIQLSWVELDRNGQEIGAQKPGSSLIRKIAESAWKKLPLGLANSVGPKLRKHISL